MCYSAQVWADYRRYIRDFGAELDIKEFYELFWRRIDEPRIKIPKAMEAAFSAPASEAEGRIKAATDTFAAAESVKLEKMVFEQRTRLADAERPLATKPTKAATNNRRIATDKSSGPCASCRISSGSTWQTATHGFSPATTRR